MLSFREATAEDAALISRINAASWRVAYRGLISDDYLSRLPEDAWTSPVRSWLDSGQLYGVIALEDDRPVGCAIFGRGRDATHADWGEIVSFYVLPDCTRRGVGGALLQETLHLLQQDGYDRVYLWSIDGNRIADEFYRKHGFRRTGDSVPYRIGSSDVTDVRYILT